MNILSVLKLNCLARYRMNMHLFTLLTMWSIWLSQVKNVFRCTPRSLHSLTKGRLRLFNLKSGYTKGLLLLLSRGNIIRTSHFRGFVDIFTYKQSSEILSRLSCISNEIVSLVSMILPSVRSSTNFTCILELRATPFTMANKCSHKRLLIPSLVHWGV